MEETNIDEVGITQKLITTRKRSCGKVMYLHLSFSHSVHRGVSMMSLHVWLSGPMFFPGDLSGPMFFIGGLCLGVSLTETPCTETPLDWDHPYGKERMVHILLECILVLKIFLSYDSAHVRSNNTGSTVWLRHTVRDRDRDGDSVQYIT